MEIKYICSLIPHLVHHMSCAYRFYPEPKFSVTIGKAHKSSPEVFPNECLPAPSASSDACLWLVVVILEMNYRNDLWKYSLIIILMRLFFFSPFNGLIGVNYLYFLRHLSHTLYHNSRNQYFNDIFKNPNCTLTIDYYDRVFHGCMRTILTFVYNLFGHSEILYWNFIMD